MLDLEFCILKGEFQEVNSLEIDSASANYANDLVVKAINYLYSELEIEKKLITFKLILARNYLDVINNVRMFKIEESNSNGTFLPIYLQKKENGFRDMPIIVINWRKINEAKAEETFIESVLVHELTHYIIDLKYFESFMEKYYICYGTEKKDILGGFYEAYSEMMAKYFQEKYNCMAKKYKEQIFIEYIEKTVTKVRDEKDFYRMQHFWGQIFCWEQLAEKWRFRDGLYWIEKAKEDFLIRYEKQSYYRYFTTIEAFWNFCDSFISEEEKN